MGFKTGDGGGLGGFPVLSGDKIVLTDSQGNLTTENEVTIAELKNLKGSTSNIQDQLDDLDNGLTILDGRVTDVESGIVTLQNNVLTNTEDIDDLEGDVTLINNTLGDVITQVNTLENNVQDLYDNKQDALPNFTNNELLVGNGNNIPRTLPNGFPGDVLSLNIVGEPVWVSGGGVGNWTNYEPTIISSATKGTIVVDRMRCRQVGQNYEVEWEFDQSSAGTAGSGNYLFTLPDGIEFHSNVRKYNGANVYDARPCSISNAGSISVTGVYFFDIVPYNDTQFRVIISTSASTGAFWGSTHLALSNVLKVTMRMSFQGMGL